MDMEYVEYKADDYGNALMAKVCRSAPEDSGSAAAKGKPIVMILHMGDYVVGSADVVRAPQITHLACTNFLVVIPNYRLSPPVGAWDGAFADTASCLAWCRQTLLSQLSQSHGVHVDATYIAANHTQLIKVVAAFYPSLDVSDPSNSAHQPYLGFTTILLLPNAAPAESIASFCPADQQISEAPRARPGTKPPPRNLWQWSIRKEGRWLETVMPGGNAELIHPCQKFAEVGHRWLPTIFVQGDKHDVPGSWNGVCGEGQ